MIRIELGLDASTEFKTIQVRGGSKNNINLTNKEARDLIYKISKALNSLKDHAVIPHEHYYVNGRCLTCKEGIK